MSAIHGYAGVGPHAIIACHPRFPPAGPSRGQGISPTAHYPLGKLGGHHVGGVPPLGGGVPHPPERTYSQVAILETDPTVEHVAFVEYARYDEATSIMGVDQSNLPMFFFHGLFDLGSILNIVVFMQQ